METQVLPTFDQGYQPRTSTDSNPHKIPNTHPWSFHSFNTPARANTPSQVPQLFNFYPSTDGFTTGAYPNSHRYHSKSVKRRRLESFDFLPHQPHQQPDEPSSGFLQETFYYSVPSVPLSPEMTRPRNEYHSLPESAQTYDAAAVVSSNAFASSFNWICNPCLPIHFSLSTEGPPRLGNEAHLGHFEETEEKIGNPSAIVTQQYLTQGPLGISYPAPQELAESESTGLLIHWKTQTDEDVIIETPAEVIPAHEVGDYHALIPYTDAPCPAAPYHDDSAQLINFHADVQPYADVLSGYGQQPAQDSSDLSYFVQPQIDRDVSGPPRPQFNNGPVRALGFASAGQKGSKRGPFKDQQLRMQTANTRRAGACGRCKMQRVRCDADSAASPGPCSRCRQSVSPNSERLVCFRANITDIRVYKPGQVPGYEWTHRWDHNAPTDIDMWQSSEEKIIKVSEGFNSAGMELKVREFRPLKGDKLERTWVFNGVRYKATIPAYAMTQLTDAKDAYRKHMAVTERGAITEVVDQRSQLLKHTYDYAYKLRSQLPPGDARKLLDFTFELWTAVRHSTRSTFIVGAETLGMPQDILGEYTPHSGKIPLPPVLGAQLDNALIHGIQPAARGKLLKLLQTLFLKSRTKHWLVIYLVTFILLHNASLIIEHDASYARKHGIQARFAREQMVRDYHHGATTLLWFFRYCNQNTYPFSDKCTDEELRKVGELTDEQVTFVKKSRVFISMQKNEWKVTRAEKRYEDGLYFVSQLYEKGWQPEEFRLPV